MSNSNSVFSELLAKIQEVLNQFNCKSETRMSDHEALLYGKFSANMEKYTVVIHLREENYKPLTSHAGPVQISEAEHKVHFMPSLELSATKSHSANCSEAEQIRIRDQFMKDAEAIGREFMQRVNKS